MIEDPDLKLAVLLHADIIGSTGLVQIDEGVAHQRMQDAFRRLSQSISDQGGSTREIRGDALVAEFAKASDAVTAALEFQSANTLHNRDIEGEIRPQIRIGIAMGEVVLADNTVTGAGIVLAQRIEQLADPGGTCIQGAVYETIPGRLPFEYSYLGEQELKGFTDPVRVYAVSEKTVDCPTKQLEKSNSVPDAKPSIAVLPLNNMSGNPEQE